MKVTGDLRDALTGKLVGRVIMYRPDERYANNEMRIANRTTNAHEQRLVFAEWSRLVREALERGEGGEAEAAEPADGSERARPSCGASMR